MIRYLALSVLIFCLMQGCGGQSDVPGTAGQDRQAPSAEYSDAPVPAVLVDTGFSQGDSQYHTMVHASDGKVYFAIGTHHRDTHVHMFSYDPSTGKVTTVADIGKVLGEDGTKTIPQGNIHCDFFEHDGGLYFATHVGFFRRGGTEDHCPYPGGHFMRYDLAKGTFTDYGIGIPEQGIVTMNMDTGRDGYLYLGCDIPVTDRDSDKAKRILALKGTYRSPEQINKGIFENNLVIVKDPLR